MNPVPGERAIVWDLPTRIFHWLLAAAVVALVVTAKIGGDDVMAWHGRLGYCVGALLMFRVVWGVIGGRWSRFASFAPSFARAWAYVRGATHDNPGHNPLGALSVYAMLFFLSLQVGSGLFAETKEDFAGPLTSIVSNGTVHFMTGYHKRIGQWVVVTLVSLHVLAIAWYALRGRNLVGPMLHGKTTGVSAAQPSRDEVRTRLVAFVAMSLCSLVMWWIARLGG